MSAFTRLGSSLWDWEPFTSLDPGPQLLWLALYTSAEAKRIVPGLWQGSITAMADASHKPVDETRCYLDKLLEHDMVEFDVKLRVLRLTQLPDAGESPANPNVLRGWWRKFTTVPACAVRDAHVPLIRWLMDTWSRDAGKPVTHGHEEAWRETFGRIPVPAPRRRGVRRLVDSDTSTSQQPSLFGTVSGSLLLPPEASSVDNSDAVHKVNHSDNSETVSKPSGSGSGIGSGSGSPEEGGSGGRLLQLVPPSPFRAPDPVDAVLALCERIAGGTWQLAPESRERAQLEDQVERLPDIDLALLGDWMRDQGHSVRIAQDLIATPGRLISAMDEATRWRAVGIERAKRAARMSEELRADLEAAGIHM